jgi:hypothetical protein
MALPRSTETPRLRYLQDIVDTATDGGWADWPVKRRRTLTPQKRNRSIAYEADRRPDPTPIHMNLLRSFRCPGCAGEATRRPPAALVPEPKTFIPGPPSQTG